MPLVANFGSPANSHAAEPRSEYFGWPRSSRESQLRTFASHNTHCYDFLSTHARR